jgi:transposase
MLRNQGSAIRQIKSGKGLRKQVDAELGIIEQVAGPDAALATRSLLDLHEAQARFVEQSDKRLARIAAAIPVVQRFLKIPGVGPICAISFYSTIGNPHRFSNTASVGSYLGMVPKLKQSGLELRRSGITKAGYALARGHLVLSAGVMISRAAGDSALRDWGSVLVGKKGYGRARLAVARKLAIIMLSIWKSGDDFRPYPT